jgi:hypothetical protein
MTSAVLLAATIALELVVPLGYAVWLAYFLAVGVTVFQRSARAPFVVAVSPASCWSSVSTSRPPVPTRRSRSSTAASAAVRS